MRAIHKLAIAAIFSVSLASTSNANDEKIQLAQELMNVTNMDQILDQTLNLLFQNISASIRQKHPNVPDRAFDILFEEMSLGFQQSNKKLEEKFAPIYAEAFSAEELKLIIDFQSSPVGQKALKLFPVITQKAAVISQETYAAALPDIMAKFQKRLQDENIQ